MTTMTTIESKASEIESKAKEILNKAYARRLVPDEAGGYVASIQEFPGCVADGDSAEEALRNLDSAAEAWLEVALAHGQDVREPISLDGFSGKIALRAPRSLHRQVAELAELEGSSINQLLVMAIAHYVGGKQILNKVSYPSYLTFNNVQINQTHINSNQVHVNRRTKLVNTLSFPPMELQGNMLKPMRLANFFTVAETTDG